jgi:hypothetical protein
MKRIKYAGAFMVIALVAAFSAGFSALADHDGTTTNHGTQQNANNNPSTGSGSSTTTSTTTGTTNLNTGDNTQNNTATSTPNTNTSTSTPDTTNQNNTNTSTSTDTSLNNNNQNATSTATSTTTTPTTTPNTTNNNTNNGNTNNTGQGSDIVGWIILSPVMFSSMSTSTQNTIMGNTNSTSSPYTYVNGYPMLGGNYVDCNGNIDNDPAHHTTDMNDTDPGHNIGKNCPGGAPKLPNQGNGMNQSNWWMFNNPFGGVFGDLLGNNPNGNSRWIIMPLTRSSLQNLF